MGKTPKKAAPEGDERNRYYVRRLKTASASAKHDDDIGVNLPAARSDQPDNENTNRGKSTTAQKNFKAVSNSKAFKSKLRSPVVKSSLSRLPKSTNRPLSIERESSKSTGISSKIVKNKVSTMQSKSEESESQASDNGDGECVDKETEFIVRSKKTDAVTCGEVNVKSQEVEVGDVGKEIEEGTEKEEEKKEKEQEQEKENEKHPNEKEIQEMVEDLHQKDNGIENHNLKIQLIDEAVIQISDNDVSKEENEEHDVKLNLTMEESPIKGKLKEELESSEESQVVEDELQYEEQLPAEVQRENGHIGGDKEDQIEEIVETENYCVDIVESTTSEISEASELVQTESEKAISKEASAELPKEDVSFLSFDPSIMLKDVQVRLNDCLKDNSNLFEITSEERSMSEPLCKDSSFGRTLRNISGRHSINRMRHVTLRNRLSPNSSLQVNVSSVSLPDEDIRDHKILRHRAGLSSTLTCNGTASERKRKIEVEECRETKKAKTDSESTLFDTSIGIHQGLRRPIQVSTPNVEAYKFKLDKLDVSGIAVNDDKIAEQEQSGILKNWCSIM